MTDLHFNIDGMSCGGCSSGLTKLLEAAPGVSAVSVSHEDNSGDVTIDETTTSRDAIVAIIEKAGYEVS